MLRTTRIDSVRD